MSVLSNPLLFSKPNYQSRVVGTTIQLYIACLGDTIWSEIFTFFAPAQMGDLYHDFLAVFMIT